jgi:hypothetical protein
LEKYKNDDLPIPVFANPVMNLHLKEIGELVEMNEEVEKIRFIGKKRISTINKKSGWLTVHVGRKTFGSLGPELGIPAELVMKAGGWEDTRTYYKRYLKIEKGHLYTEVNNAWDGLEKPKPKSKTKSKPKPKLQNKLRAVK